MYLENLDLKNFRSFTELSVNLASHANLITGKNGSGKTTILEAVYFLTKKRSFVTRSHKHLIQDNTKESVIFASISGPNQPQTNIGVSIQPGNLRIKINKKNAKIREILTLLPSNIVEAGSSNVFLQSPPIKRKFIDLGVFHVEPLFLDAYLNYRKALENRNAAIRNDTSLVIWDKPLIEYGKIITSHRSHFINVVNQYFERLSDVFFGHACSIRFYKGWRGDRFSDAISKSLLTDKKYGYTQIGPHRADYDFFSKRGLVKDFFSRGQMKVIYSIFILAKTHAFKHFLGTQCVLMLDDPLSELDDDSLEFLIGETKALDVQLILTSIRENSLFSKLNPKTFHVEQGRISEV
jgi:DNA replication and repair protein RecF